MISTRLTNYENNEGLEISEPEMTSNPEARNALLKALKEKDCHTMRQFKNETNLPVEVIQYELAILEQLEVAHRPGPPLSTWWEIGKVPEGRIYIGPNGCVEIIAPEKPKDFTTEIKRKNSELKKKAVPTKPQAERVAAEVLPPKTETPAVQETIPNNLVPKGEVYINLPISIVRLHPENPRDFISTAEESFIELTDSIREKGVQEPLIVSPNPDGKTYRVVMGNRRRLASEAAGKTEVPCIIRKYASMDEEIEVMLIENIQRQNLKPTQEGRAFEKLLKQAKDIHSVARRIGLTQSYISSRIKLLRLDPLIQRMIDDGEMPMQAGLELAVLPFEKQKALIPRASRLKTADLKIAVQKLKENLGIKRHKPTVSKTRVTTDEERFTRTGAIKSLKDLGDAWFGAKILIDAFDDTCLDSCLESKDETICHSCPVPRLIASITRRAEMEKL